LSYCKVVDRRATRLFLLLHTLPPAQKNLRTLKMNRRDLFAVAILMSLAACQFVAAPARLRPSWPM